MTAVTDDLLLYYERELTYLRQMGAQFAARYPKVAARLQLEPTKCEDPHVERLLEGFAFLAARLHHKMDDDVPEISEALLGVLYPHFVRPVPSITLVEFETDATQLAGPVRVPQGSQLLSASANGTRCRFATSYDVTLWPVSIGAAQWTTPDRLELGRVTGAVGALRVELRCGPAARFDQLDLDSLRLHLAGDAAIADTLYELLCNNCVGIVARDLNPNPAARRPPLALSSAVLRPVGFTDADAVLPHPRRSFSGYRLLQEYFAFPAKFLFLDVHGLGGLRDAGFGTEPGSGVELVFLVSAFERAERRRALEAGVSAESVRLGCTPAVNLFSQTSEPIALTQRRIEYPVVADARRRLDVEVYSIDELFGVTPGRGEGRRIEPLYSYRHARGGAARGREAETFWHAARRPTTWRTDEGTELHLSFADLAGRSVLPDAEVVTARVTCCNGNLPSRLQLGTDPRGDFELPGGASGLTRVTCRVKPTPAVQPTLGKASLWRLVSVLSLNHLSLVEEGKDALQEMLRLHNVGNSEGGDRQIDGILAVRSGRAYARVASAHGLTFAHGRKVEIEFDEEQFPGGGAFLFASVLEQFLALYASINTFSQLEARTRQRRTLLRSWAPRAGWQGLS